MFLMFVFGLVLNIEIGGAGGKFKRYLKNYLQHDVA